MTDKALQHNNIISILSTEEQKRVPIKLGLLEVSYIVMELAPFRFKQLVVHEEFIKDEILQRTYFAQLINALEYLHMNGIAHLDIKPDNLLLAEDYQLKIIDFDLAYKKEDLLLIGRGTMHYRSPELKAGSCKKPMLSDIYSAGILLFVMKFGILPYREDELVDNKDLQTLLYTNPQEFWKFHERFLADKTKVDSDFKDLFIGMTREKYYDRLNIRDIKKNKWFLGPKYGNQELRNLLRDKWILHSCVN